MKVKMDKAFNETEKRNILSLESDLIVDKNFSIMAGAGAGKTTLLSKRITNQIVKGIPIEEFAIITYTNAAAEELRAKITDSLERKICSGKLDDNEKKNVESALHRMDIMQTSTIHSFLLKILKEHAFESGISLNVRLLEDNEYLERLAKFYNEWFKRNSDIVDSVSRFFAYKSTEGRINYHHRDVCRNLFYDIAEIRDDINVHSFDADKLIEQKAKAYVDDCWDEFEDFISYCKEEKNIPIKDQKAKGKEKYAAPLKVMNQLFDCYSDLCLQRSKGGSDESVAEGLYKVFRIITDSKTKYFNKKDKEGKEDLIEALASDLVLHAKNKHPEWLDYNINNYIEFVINAAAGIQKILPELLKLREEYHAYIDSVSTEISNDDILYRTKKLLLDHSDILDLVRKQYSKIYVDEMQDTSIIQTDIVKMICEEPGSPALGGELSEKKLVFVGDPKQSIYRFAGAELEAYKNLDKSMDSLHEEKAESVVLRDNYRSNSSLVDWINKTYSIILGSDYSEMTTSWKVNDTDALHGVFQCKSASKENGLANLIINLIDNDKCFIEEIERDNKGNVLGRHKRRLRFSDIMVLFRNAKTAGDFASVLINSGIPSSVEGKTTLENDALANNLVNLLDYISDPNNETKLATAVHIVTGADYAKRSKETIECENCVKDTFKRITSECHSVEGIVQYLLQNKEMLMPDNSWSSTEENGDKGEEGIDETLKAEILHLHHMVETCLSDNEGDLSSLVNRMRAYIAEKDVRNLKPEKEANEVRLMNIHKAKGLTGNVVIVVDKARSNNTDYGYDGFRRDGNYYPASSYKIIEESSVKKLPSYGYDDELLEYAKNQNEKEAKRLEYVASTRAAHALIIAKGGRSKWFSDKAYELEELEDISEWLAKKNDDNESCEIESRKDISRHIVLEDLVDSVSKMDTNKVGTAPVTDINPSRLEPDGVTGYTSNEKGYKEDKRPVGSTFGTILHRVCELMVSQRAHIDSLDANAREEVIKKIVARALIEKIEDMDEEEAAEINDYLCSVMPKYYSDVLVPILADAVEVHTEYPFSFYVPDEEVSDFMDDFNKYCKAASDPFEITSETIWVNGIADLVVKHKDGSVTVYDYKSDSRNGKPDNEFKKALMKKYEGQLSLYRYAIGKAFDESEVDSKILDLYLIGEDE